ncbi:MAG TPA: hypothetical protein DDW86_04185 [Clostridiales bacterium]|nr:hypothetical protein [Clostridiales bacterium]
MSVTKALYILEELIVDPEGLGLIDLSNRVSMNKTTVYRILTSLMERDFVEQDNITGKYKLGMKILSLAHTFYDRLDLRGLIRQFFDTSNEEESIVVVKPYSNNCSLIDVIGNQEMIRNSDINDCLKNYISIKEVYYTNYLKWKNVDTFYMGDLSKQDQKELRQKMRLIAIQGYDYVEADYNDYPSLCIPIYNYARELAAMVCLFSKQLLDKNYLSEKILEYTDKGNLISRNLGLP